MQTLIEVLRIAPIVVALGLLAFVDVKELRVPNKILIGLLGLRAFIYVLQLFTISSVVDLPGIFIPDFLPALVFCLFFLACTLLVKGGMGMGDVKLIGVTTLFLGFRMTFTTLFFAFIFSFLAAIFLVAVKKRGRKQAVPFVPFLFLGSICSVVVVLLGVV